MIKNYEFKVRFIGELEDWEELPVIMTGEVEEEKILRMIDNTFLNSYIKEIRYNQVGCYQGHYYTPKNAREE